MKVLVDVLGGDNAPKAVLDGAMAALAKEEDLTLILVGPEQAIKDAIKEKGIDPNRVEIIPSEVAVNNSDHPLP